MRIQVIYYYKRLADILAVLIAIRKYGTNGGIESYVSEALTSGVLDKKTAKHIEELMSN